MCIETPCIEEATERPSVVERPLGALEKVRSVETDMLSSARTELIFVDCAGLCEE
jgi:hypothetical protein